MADVINFSGGLQTKTSQFLQKDTQVVSAINVRFDKEIGAVIKRGGYGKIQSTTGQIHGLCSYHDQTTDNRWLMFIDGITVKSILSPFGATTTITTIPTMSAVSFTRASMSVFLNQVFIYGALANSFITPVNIEGTSPSTTRNLTGSPKARVCEVYKDQLYLGDCEVDGVRYGSRLYYSSVPDALGTIITWPTTNYETVSNNNGDSITALHTNHFLNELLIFKENSLHIWDGYRIRDIGNFGTVSDRSIVTVNGVTYWYNHNGGVFAYSGGLPVKVSKQIESTLRSAATGIVGNPTNIHAVKEDENIYRLFVGGGNSGPYNEFVFSQSDNTWTQNRYDNYLDCFSFYVNHKFASSGVIETPTLIAAGAYGNIYRMDKNGTYYDDNETPISSELTTKYFDLSAYSKRKYANRITIYSSNPGSLTGRVRFRGKDWESYFPINENQQVVNINPQDGRFCQFHFSEISMAEPWILQGFSFEPMDVGNDV